MNFFVKTVLLRVCVKTNSCLVFVASISDKLATTDVLKASSFVEESANLVSRGLSWSAEKSLICSPLSFLYFSSSKVTWATLPKLSISIILLCVFIFVTFACSYFTISSRKAQA